MGREINARKQNDQTIKVNKTSLLKYPYACPNIRSSEKSQEVCHLKMSSQRHTHTHFLKSKLTEEAHTSKIKIRKARRRLPISLTLPTKNKKSDARPVSKQIALDAPRIEAFQ